MHPRQQPIGLSTLGGAVKVGEIAKLVAILFDGFHIVLKKSRSLQTLHDMRYLL